MNDLIAALRAKLDEIERLMEAGITDEVAALAADGCPTTREELIAFDVEQEGHYTIRMRRCTADRKIVDLCEAVEGRAGSSAENEARWWLMADVLDLLAEGYGIEVPE